MTKWYSRSIEVVTKRNLITVLLFLNSLFLFTVQKISDSKTAKIFGIFSFSMGIGQYIGERRGFKRKKNFSPIFIIFILFISLISTAFGENGAITSMILLWIVIGEQTGFAIGRARAKRQID